MRLFTKIPQNEAVRLGIENEKGLLVEGVMPGSPAARSGIRRYDLITHADDKELEKAFDLKSLVAKKNVGKKLTLKIIRNQKRLTTSVLILDDPSQN